LSKHFISKWENILSAQQQQQQQQTKPINCHNPCDWKKQNKVFPEQLKMEKKITISPEFT
jgi:hypothetical protein